MNNFGFMSLLVCEGRLHNEQGYFLCAGQPANIFVRILRADQIWLAPAKLRPCFWLSNSKILFPWFRALFFDLISLNYRNFCMIHALLFQNCHSYLNEEVKILVRLLSLRIKTSFISFPTRWGIYWFLN